MKLKIARIFFEAPPIIGGSVTHTLELAERIDQYLEEQVMIFPNFYTEDPKCKLKKHNIKIDSSVFKSNLFPLTIKKIIFCILAFKFIKKNYSKDYILHVHNETTGSLILLLNTLFRTDYSIVIMKHGGYKIYYTFQIIQDLISKSILNILSPSYILLLDDGTGLGSYKKSLKMGEVAIVNHAIDTDVYKKILYNNLNKYANIIIVNKLGRVKNVDDSIFIFSEVIKKIPACKLTIVGDGECRLELEALVKKLNIEHSIEFTGDLDRNRVVDLYQNADLAISTSHYSNLNRSVQEAMACELPVVTYNNGEMNKLIEDGANGYLVDEFNINKFSNIIVQLLLDDRKRLEMGKNARNTIINTRNWSHRIDLELKVYNKIMNNI